MSITHNLVKRMGFDPKAGSANGYSWTEHQLYYNEKTLYDERIDQFGFNPTNEGEVLALKKTALHLWGEQAELSRLPEPSLESQQNNNTMSRKLAGSVAGNIAGKAIGASTPIPGGAMIGGVVGSYVGEKLATSDLFAQKFGIFFKNAPDKGLMFFPVRTKE